MTSVLQDLLDPELVSNDIRVTVNKIFGMIIDRSTDRSLLEKSKTIGNAKSLNEVYGLVKTAVEDFEKRANIPNINKIIFTEEDPNVDSQTETITFSLIKREPGAFGQGAPFESRTKNLRPLFREELQDKENPGYRLVTTGYWHDNLIRFTCWARTNKTANARALWFERLMDEYSWWFKTQGVDRMLFWERAADISVTIDNNKWYGRPLDYFVRTETLRVFSEKTIEEILVDVGLDTI